MRLRATVITAAFACAIFAVGCKSEKPTANNATPVNANQPATPKMAGPLPESGYKAQITVPDPPAKLRAGQKETIVVHVKNASDVMWWLRGGETTDRNDNKFYIAVGNRWLDKDGKLLDEMQGRNAIPKDLKPGEEADVSLLITAPKETGEYTLEVDMVQEQVSWFSEKGSQTFKTKVSVVK